MIKLNVVDPTLYLESHKKTISKNIQKSPNADLILVERKITANMLGDEANQLNSGGNNPGAVIFSMKKVFSLVDINFFTMSLPAGNNPTLYGYKKIYPTKVSAYVVVNSNFECHLHLNQPDGEETMLAENDVVKAIIAIMPPLSTYKDYLKPGMRA